MTNVHFNYKTLFCTLTIFMIDSNFIHEINFKFQTETLDADWQIIIKTTQFDKT